MFLLFVCDTFKTLLMTRGCFNYIKSQERVLTFLPSPSASAV